MPEVDVPIAIVGAGFSGLGMGAELRRAGRDDFVIFESHDELGGTWRDNDYPGCACDIPSHLYSYSFNPNPDWSESYAPHDEILAYLKSTADEYDLHRKIQFETEIESTHYNEEKNRWRLITGGGETITARSVVLGVGPLHRPKIPDIPGLDQFDGEMFHSAEWNHDYDLDEKNVAVVGTGASAIQFVTEIAEQTDQLHVLQRTPPWVMPRPDRKFTAIEKWAFRNVPGVQRLYRTLDYLLFETRAAGFVSNPALMKGLEWLSERFIDSKLDDPALKQKVTPDYRMGCKRILVSSDYYPALGRDDVELIDDALARVESDAVVTEAGERREVDAIIFATGFHVTDFLAEFQVTGRGGQNLNDAWRDGAEAYYGMTVHDFPNLFMLVGPNTGLGHNSIVFMIECQTNYIRQCLEELDERDAEWMDVRTEVQRDFIAGLRDRMVGTVWKSGCDSWYLEEDGKNTTLWPGYTFEYWLETRSMDPEDFDFGR